MLSRPPTKQNSCAILSALTLSIEFTIDRRRGKKKKNLPDDELNKWVLSPACKPYTKNEERKENTGQHLNNILYSLKTQAKVPALYDQKYRNRGVAPFVSSQEESGNECYCYARMTVPGGSSSAWRLMRIHPAEVHVGYCGGKGGRPDTILELD
ncbi:hypothetical protein OUZ56_004784 [Daphnia magna]|uniref:Uncharacterized protein n=1 Tax=Daphnia magna TaxID=35525 RepID=A0ABQ9YR69_9CRUS|nr:hypothetical protein OUZ56_004784 [Daphnia magna]